MGWTEITNLLPSKGFGGEIGLEAEFTPEVYRPDHFIVESNGMNTRVVCAVMGSAMAAMIFGTAAWAQLPGEGPRLGDVSITQQQIADGELSHFEIRQIGMRMFSTPFNKSDGYGDGPMDPDDPIAFGKRPTLQGNGTFLRVNGLDGQTCLECHSIISNVTIPAKFGVGGVGGAVSNAMFMPTQIDVLDDLDEGEASFTGRFINPPFLFGSGGVELLGKEMTEDLQAMRAEAIANPGQDVMLRTKGVVFGVIRFENGELDTSRVEGVDGDLVVKPFGRKGEFPTTRAFDVDALRFHFGMEPVEAVGLDVDNDGDGVFNEIMEGELSALEIFNTTLPRPIMDPLTPDARDGSRLFSQIGCADCHRPFLMTRSRELTYSLPEVAEDPSANVFYSADLSEEPTGFTAARGGGLIVPLFADLKRHDMGEALAESFGSPLDSFFTTARLWGVADTAPYMHDGRALTIGEAILMHGGEAESVRDNYVALSEGDKRKLLSFLHSLRTPKSPTADLEE